MALPLGRATYDVQPGGGIVTAMGGYNALSDAMLKTQQQQIQNQYLPLTSQAEAASKLAYANLMGPQFLAKLMGNTDILANMPDPQKRQALNMVYSAGSGQGTGANYLNNVPQGWFQGQQSPSSFAQLFQRGPNNVFGQPNQPMQQTQLGNGQVELPPLPPPPGYSSQSQQNQVQYQPAQSSGNQQPSAQVANYQPPVPSYPNMQNQPKTWAETTGQFKGIEKEGEKGGEIRAKDMDDLGKVYESALQKRTTLNELNKLLVSPEMQQIRQLPFGQQHEIGWYSKFGTPQQQQVIGQFKSTLGNIVKDAAQDFKGQFRKGEQTLVNSMKVNDGDSMNVALGKAQSLSYFNEIMAQRSKMANDLMGQYHMNRLDALDAADSHLNGDQIRDHIYDSLNPTVTIRNTKTGEKMTVPIQQARAKYGIQP